MSAYHDSIRCDVCSEVDFAGVRYYCLLCDNYDLCEGCYNERRVNLQHQAYHPMQSILPELEFLESVNQTAVEKVSIYVCPYCGDNEFNPPDLLQHCKRYHLDNLHLIRCPICPVYNLGPPSLITTQLWMHLLDIHKEYCMPTRGPSAPCPNEAECSICVESLSRTSNNRSLPCGHCFHSTCIDRWLEENPTCPVCRTGAEI